MANPASQRRPLGRRERSQQTPPAPGVDSGTFKLKLYSARSFGLVEIKNDGIVLTDLGNQIIRSDSEAKARAIAFMTVPLYRAIYDLYKGRLLPGDAALEADMVKLGVAPKQKSRARQGFQRSAEQAKLGKEGR